MGSAAAARRWRRKKRETTIIMMVVVVVAKEKKKDCDCRYCRRTGSYSRGRDIHGSTRRPSGPCFGVHGRPSFFGKRPGLTGMVEFPPMKTTKRHHDKATTTVFMEPFPELPIHPMGDNENAQ